jgi:hypothetical protein
VESRAGFMALKEQQKLEKELTGYVEWICRAGSRDVTGCCSFGVEGWKKRRSRSMFSTLFSRSGFLCFYARFLFYFYCKSIL